ncbi:YncE family protein [Saccharospirillum salsuginis]|nr:hypothetical protein [Saccharospirillum salsuginis]
MTLTADFQVEDANGFDDVDHVRLTFPDGTYYILDRNENLYKRNGVLYFKGFIYMDSESDTGERSFPMHGYKAEVFDTAGASTSQIFSIAGANGEEPAAGSVMIHPNDYSSQADDQVSGLSIPIVNDVTRYDDGLSINVTVSDDRVGEIQFWVADSDENWFMNYLELDASVIETNGSKTYKLPLDMFNINSGYSLSDAQYVAVNTYDAGDTKSGPFEGLSWLGSSSVQVSINTVLNEPLEPITGEHTGVVLDSRIQGLTYQTSSGVEGVTSALGQFDYNTDDTVQFSIGSLVFPEVAAKPVMTLLDLLETDNHQSQEVTNLARLIQTLDDDGLYEESIVLTQDNIAAVTSNDILLNDLSVAPDTFESSYKISGLIWDLDTVDALVTEEVATDHFISTLQSSELLDTDGDGNSNAIDSDDDNDGIADDQDAFPWDANEWSDHDGDGIGDVADPDDDNDGIDDAQDTLLSDLYPLPDSLPVITESMLLPSKGYVVFSHKDDNSVTILNVPEMTEAASINFSRMPNRMTVSPDISTLYIALMDNEFVNSTDETGQSGAVAIIDLSDLTLTGTLPVEVDPYDLVATDSGHIVVSSGSDQWTTIEKYDTSNSLLLDSATIRQRSRLFLSADQSRVFAADTDLNPSDIESFDISGDTIVSEGDSPYHGDHRMSGNVWATPNGDYLITRGGDLFNALDMTFVDELTVSGVMVEAIGFDTVNSKVLLAQSNGRIKQFASTTMAAETEWTMYGTPFDISLANGDRYYLTDGENGFRLVVDDLQ